MSVATCGRCGARLRFGESLAGAVGRCGGCGGTIRLPQSAGVGSVAGDSPIIPRPDLDPLALDSSESADRIAHDEPRHALSLKPPERLGRYNHYLVCNSKEVIAHWEDDGRGWMFKVKDGYVRASTIPAQIPSMGVFILIEIDIERVEGHQRLRAVRAFQLSGPWALGKLFKSDDMILESIVGRADMNDRQKAMARERINDKFLPQVWDGAEEVLR